MNNKIPFLIRFSVTVVSVIAAIIVLLYMYQNYLRYPWTRDAQVEADVIQLTSRVSGHIVKLPITENQLVKKGTVIWKIDPKTYQANVEKAQASLQKAKAALNEAHDVVMRVRNLSKLDVNAISKVKKTKAENKYQEAQAAVSQAKADLHTAQLNLKYTIMAAPSDGYITNLQIAIGSYVTANKGVFPFVDASSFRLEAFFKETLIRNVHVGDKAVITLMAYPNNPIEGVVNSVSRGIAKEDGSPGVDLLPDVNPSFDWIRLAQRLPVRIHFKKLPEKVNLSVGFTASVIILPKDSAAT
jgi:RND family efflux transporter MFP subunit